RLEASGHTLGDEPDGVRVWPEPGIIISVGIAPDATLKRDYRRRYFACSPDAGKILERGGFPNVLRGYPLSFLQQLRPGPGCSCDFLAGPGAWVLARLGQFDRVLVWLADFPGRPWWSAEELARTAGHLQAPLPFPSLLPGAGTSSRPRAFLVPTQGEAFA